MKTDANAQSQALTGRDRLAAGLAAVAGEAGELLNQFSDQKLQRARKTLTEVRSKIAGGANEFSAVAREYVHAHPWRAIGAAGVAGLVLGLLIARR